MTWNYYFIRNGMGDLEMIDIAEVQFPGKLRWMGPPKWTTLLKPEM